MRAGVLLLAAVMFSSAAAFAAAPTPTPTVTATTADTPTPTPAPTCAPTGTPYCSDHCPLAPTRAPGCDSPGGGPCSQNPTCGADEACVLTYFPYENSGCCTCATVTPTSPTPTNTLTPTETPTPPFMYTPTCTFGPIVFPLATASPNPAHPGDIVTLDGSRSYEIYYGPILSSAWTQLAGPSVNLSGADSASATFVAPVVSASTTLTFQLFVHGSPGGRCDGSDGSVQITVTVRPSSCVGDCGGTLTLADTDIITLVNIVLGNASPSACPHGIPSGTTVNVALIIQAVNNALNGCPH
jgi:hypothetical protein